MPAHGQRIAASGVALHSACVCLLQDRRDPEQRKCDVHRPVIDVEQTTPLTITGKLIGFARDTVRGQIELVETADAVYAMRQILMWQQNSRRLSCFQRT